MPPGGHIEPDEDPVAAVLREIREETGVTAEVIPLPPSSLSPSPARCSRRTRSSWRTSPSPTSPTSTSTSSTSAAPWMVRPTDPSPDPTLLWVEEGTLRANRPLNVAGRDLSAPIATDVRLLALIAIDTARQSPDSRP